jgi:arsenate reductase (thioredoxin)
LHSIRRSTSSLFTVWCSEKRYDESRMTSLKTLSPVKVMFLCIGNSCRSQMAEGLAREIGRGILDPYSAGLMAAGVHPRAISVMEEIGIDISKQKSKQIDEGLLRTMDIVVTLCVGAYDACPRTSSDVPRLHWPVKDPVGAIGSREEVMKEFRRARDEIRDKIEELVRTMKRREKSATS